MNSATSQNRHRPPPGKHAADRPATAKQLALIHDLLRRGYGDSVTRQRLPTNVATLTSRDASELIEALTNQ